MSSALCVSEGKYVKKTKKQGGYLGCNVEVLMLLQQLLGVVDAGARGRVCGQVELTSVMDPLKSLENTLIHVSTCLSD